MDVLNAVTVPIGDRIYRLIPVRDSLKNVEEDETPIRTHFEGDDDVDFDPDLPIVHQGNKFHITFNVPRELIKHIVGKQNRTKQILEKDGAKINIPSGRRPGDQEGLINITGSTKMIVGNTYHRVMNIANMSRLRIESTHFISLPMNSFKIQESFLKFKEEILQKHKRGTGIEESIFQNPKKLHLTVVPLVLLNERDNQNTIAILTECIDNILGNFNEKELVVQVQGIEYMNDDPAEVDVLYAKVQEPDGDNKLQIIADNIMNAFYNANLSRKQHEKVKLHITLMNTLFRDKLENKDDDDDKLRRKTFDARSILKEYGDYEFGQMVVSEIHISVRYTAAPDGYYIPIKKIRLNP